MQETKMHKRIHDGPLDNEFACDLYREIKKTLWGNKFYSPFSIGTGLSMAASGAKGMTRIDMAMMINVAESNAITDEQYRVTLESLNSVDGCTLKIANSIIVNSSKDSEFVIDGGYRSRIANYYYGLVGKSDFDNEPTESVKSINDWVSFVTEGKIKDLVDEKFISKCKAVLLNAIYFKGDFVSQFDADDTVRDNFFQDSRSTTPCKMMNQTTKFRHVVWNHNQVLEMPYKGNRLSLVLVLPKVTNYDEAKAALSSTENKLFDSNDKVQDLLSQIHHSPRLLVQVSLPKFKMDVTIDNLVNILKDNLDYPLPFSDEADFSDVGRPNLKIAKIIHKAVVEVNELGTEAAAATGIGMAECCAAMDPPEVVRFNANHPFLFMIVDNTTGLILFNGSIETTSI